MKLIIKDKKSEYYIQIESLDKKVIDLKIEMQNQFKLDLKKIKLIYNGKSLLDNQTLKSYQIKEDSKLIFLGVIEEANIISKKEENSLNFEDSNENNEEYSSQLHNLIQLGYEKEKAKSIIKKFNGDIKKIIEFLSNAKSDEKDNNNNKINKINNIKNDEKINQKSDEKINLPQELKNYGVYMKILTLKDENKMNIILNNIKKNNPALFNQIKNHEQDLIKFLSSPITQEEIDIYKKNFKNANALLDEGDKKDKYNEIFLNEKESEIINNLQEIANVRIEEAIEAYFISDKDENEALNYLFRKNMIIHTNLDEK